MRKAFFQTTVVAGFMTLAVAMGHTQQTSSPIQVRITDGKIIAEQAALPLDPVPRIAIGHAGGNYFGLTVEGKRITCTPQGSVWSTARVDNQEINPAAMNIVFIKGGGQNLPIPPGPFGKKRLGTQTTYKMGSLDITQTIEIVPSKIEGKAAPGQKRKLDTARITYLIENKDSRPHLVEWRVGIDILVGNNDGALFASPTTHPGKILDGVELKGKAMPDTLQVLENPNLKAPGFVAHMTFNNGGQVENPNRVILTGLGGIGTWDAQVMQANGDSACAIYWEGKTLKPGEKRTLGWAYGGGIAASLENEGKVSLALGGSFEPGKLFTITAFVDDPIPSQTLTLELPAGMTLREGKEIQPVAAPVAAEPGVVLWKASVEKTGDYQVKVHSNSGVTQIKNISIRTAAP